jgi:CRISPR-associated protein Cas6
MEADKFEGAAKRQIQKIGVQAELHLGERRTFRIKDKQVVGFEVVVSLVNAADSLRIQEVGVGGRRKIGCGIFVPFTAHSGPGARKK